MKVISKTLNGFITEVSKTEMEYIIGVGLDRGAYWHSTDLKSDELVGKVVSTDKIIEAVKNIDTIVYMKKKMLTDINDLKENINKVFFPLTGKPVKFIQDGE